MLKALLAFAVTRPLITIKDVALLDDPCKVTTPLVVAPPSRRMARSPVLRPSPHRVRVVPLADVSVSPPQASKAFVPPPVVIPLIRLSPLVPVVVKVLLPFNTMP